MKKIGLVHIFLFLMMATGFSQTDFNKAIGYWQGYLHYNQDSLMLVLSIEKQGDSVRVELDSPDQYSMGLAVNLFMLKKDTIILEASKLSAKYQGTITSDGDTIAGFFTQHKNKQRLALRRMEKRILINRPQEPQPPYHYIIEEHEVKNEKTGKTLIQGTLTLPSQGKSKALLILISGSGWQDRNETIFGHKPFKVMADYFTRNGYAVYRYDDFPKGEFAKSTTLDFADAVFLIVNFFKNDKRFQDCPVGLIGHSEGGLITFIAASQDKRIDFIISLAGVGEHISQTLLYQMEAITRANGELSEAEVAESVEISSHLYSILEKSKSKEKALKECGDYYDAYTRNMPQEVKERIGVSTGKKIAMMQTLGSPWFYTLFHLYPKQYLKKVKCPVYALNGEKDLQVNYISNLGGIQKYLAKNKNLKIESFPRLNHLFQECETGLPEEYGKIEQTISPLVLERMLNWMNEIVK